MIEQLPKCFGKLPDPDLRSISCGVCKRLDDCFLAKMQKDLAKHGIVTEKVSL